VFVCLVVVRVLGEWGVSSAAVAEQGLMAIGNLTINNEANRQLLGDAGAAAGTHIHTYKYKYHHTNNNNKLLTNQLTN